MPHSESYSFGWGLSFQFESGFMKPFCTLLAIVFLMLGAGFAIAQDANTQVDALAKGDFKDRETAITALASSGQSSAVSILEALSAGNLYQRKTDKKVFIVQIDGDNVILHDPVSGADAGKAAKSDVEKIKVNNALRTTIENALGGLTLFSKDVNVRKQAALSILKSGDAIALVPLQKAIAVEADPAVKELMRGAIAAATLNSDLPEPDKLAAIQTLSLIDQKDIAALLSSFADKAQGNLKISAQAAADKMNNSANTMIVVQNIWYGLSLGSVLLLAAIGLAITFGVMGVINMAHGEMIMLGAYTTYVVQQLFQAYLPGVADYSLLAAIPVAFLFTGMIGILIERSVIRFLYGRPLETMLATWGLSLILQQAVRSVFGPTNKEVTTPSWMSGSVEIVSGLSLTLNRVAIVVFAMVVFTVLLIAMRKSTFGLQMRAVTQNRQMANAMGIRSNIIDSLTFGLGSGIAGIAGVALSQIDNVSPNLGQNYIIDSFLVVVFGGVGNLWGTFAGALALGVTNKFLEPFTGAVLGKIFILVAVILFIQKRPRGLFALKGRWVEA